jgi:HEPN domain-containing protein
MQQSRAIDWFRQADEDLRWGQTSLGGGHFSQTCFIAQQVAEKAAKAIAFQRGAAEIRGHSVLASSASSESTATLKPQPARR